MKSTWPRRGLQISPFWISESRKTETPRVSMPVTTGCWLTAHADASDPSHDPSPREPVRRLQQRPAAASNVVRSARVALWRKGDTKGPPTTQRPRAIRPLHTPQTGSLAEHWTIPRKRDARPRDRTHDQAVRSSVAILQGDCGMRPYPRIVRLTILAALALGSGFGGGWKWDFLPH